MLLRRRRHCCHVLRRPFTLQRRTQLVRVLLLLALRMPALRTVLAAVVQTKHVRGTLETFNASLLVNANRSSSAILAHVALASVVANAAPTAFLALAPLPLFYLVC